MNQDRPTLDELIRTAREFVDSASARLPEELKYEAQVASYLLAIAEREVLYGAEHAWQDNQRLAAFFGTAGSTEEMIASLCARIREGRCDEQWDQTMQLVLGLVVSKVAIVRPDRLHPMHAIQGR